MRVVDNQNLLILLTPVRFLIEYLVFPANPALPVLRFHLSLIVFLGYPVFLDLTLHRLFQSHQLRQQVIVVMFHLVFLGLIYLISEK